MATIEYLFSAYKITSIAIVKEELQDSEKTQCSMEGKNDLVKDSFLKRSSRKMHSLEKHYRHFAANGSLDGPEK